MGTIIDLGSELLVDPSTIYDPYLRLMAIAIGEKLMLECSAKCLWETRRPEVFMFRDRDLRLATILTSVYLSCIWGLSNGVPAI